MNVSPTSGGLQRVALVDAPQGFAQLLPGWNVWELWQANDPIESPIDVVMNAGLSADRLLRIWVENWIKDNAPGAAVADPMNPAALRGEQVQIIPSAGTLEVMQTRGDVPGLAGALQIGEEGSKVTKRFVRFWNRGEAAAVPWAHDQNYLLESVYQPSATNPITSGPAPSSLGGAATDIANKGAEVLKVVGIVAGVGLGLVLLAKAVQAGSSRRS